MEREKNLLTNPKDQNGPNDHVWSNECVKCFLEDLHWMWLDTFKPRLWLVEINLVQYLSLHSQIEAKVLLKIWGDDQWLCHCIVCNKRQSMQNVVLWSNIALLLVVVKCKGSKISLWRRQSFISHFSYYVSLQIFNET